VCKGARCAKVTKVVTSETTARAGGQRTPHGAGVGLTILSNYSHKLLFSTCQIRMAVSAAGGPSARCSKRPAPVSLLLSAAHQRQDGEHAGILERIG
jgi:hypothetical protein